MIHLFNRKCLTRRHRGYLSQMFCIKCFKISNTLFIPMLQLSGQRQNLFPSRFPSHLMFPMCLLSVVFVENKVCNCKIDISYVFINRFLNIFEENMSTGDLGGLTCILYLKFENVTFPFFSRFGY